MTITRPPTTSHAAQGFQDEDPDLSYALLSEGDSRLPDHIQCSRCRGIFPRALFKKRTTKAQAKGWGKSGAYKLEIISKNCESCRPKLRPPRKLTPKELITRATTGDLNLGAVVIKDMIDRRIQDGKDRIRAGVRRRVTKQIQNEWTPMLNDAVKARTQARDRLKYLKRKGEGREVPVSGVFDTSLVSVISYAEAVLRATSHAAAILRHNKTWAQKRDADITSWTDILPHETKQELTTLFDAIPHAERVKMRPSAILTLNNIVETSSTTTQGEVK